MMDLLRFGMFVKKKSVTSISHMFPVTAVAFDDTATCVFTGSIDNLIRCWDTRNLDKELFVLPGHGDSITSLRLDPYGSYLLSNSMDQDLRIWDIRPYAPQQRCIKIMQGATHSFESSLIKANWGSNGAMIGSGSADRHVYIWDTTSREIKYRLPGHNGTVNEVSFHPTEPIVASCSTDKTIYLGEIEEYQ
eukprot:TRINITY_DN2692_c0_g1_i1.p2 TRINITY_DN2692_c0_g1~~TRINITY_DN2692_c0_g1_i1.p2  ORF type:complete len:191 (-),score=35.07 TRINITY_DN2692_c0_g1_i1:15-587(-)